MKTDVKIAFFDTKPYDTLSFDGVNETYGYTIKYFPYHLSIDTVALTKGFDAVCIFVNDSIPPNIVEQLYANGVKLIALRSAGYNNVDLKAVFNLMHVVRVPEYSPHAIAEHALALIFSLNRKTHRAYVRTRDGNFSINGLLGVDLYGKTIGIIGTGKIGRTMAMLCRGVGMRVVAYDMHPNESFAKDSDITYMSLEELYQQSDIISLHCPLTPENKYMIHADTINIMKDGVVIINTGRGQLINSKDLIESLKNKKIGAAGLDVYEEESEYFFEDFSGYGIDDDVLARLLTFPNVLITSHQAFFTKEALHNIAQTTMDNIRLFFDTGELPNEICYKCNAVPCTKKTTGRCF